MNKSIYPLIRKSIKSSFSGLGAYLVILGGTEGVLQTCSEKIKDKSYLEEIVKEERKLLNIPENKKIDLVLVKKENCASARKISENSYEIKLSETDNTRSTIQHELYHISDGHCDMKINNAIEFLTIYFFWAEPRAIMYQAKRAFQK